MIQFIKVKLFCFSLAFFFIISTQNVFALNQNGASCNYSSECASGYCYRGPESVNYCIAAVYNCAKPMSAGAFFGESYIFNNKQYSCVSGVGLVLNSAVDSNIFPPSGAVGIGTVTPDPSSMLDIRNNKDENQFMLLRSGLTADQRNYFYWLDFKGIYKWAFGRNGSNSFIWFDRDMENHRMQLDSNGPSYFSSGGNTPVVINGFGEANTGTGGLEVYSGSTSTRLTHRFNSRVTYINSDTGIGTDSPSQKLDVKGNVRIGTSGSNGCLQRADGTAIAGFCNSDIRLKDNVKNLNIENLSDKILKVNPISFSWNNLAYSLYKKVRGTTSYGFSAQNIESAFPELVKTDENGYKLLDNASLNVYLFAALKETIYNVKTIALRNNEIQKELNEEKAKRLLLEKRISDLEKNK